MSKRRHVRLVEFLGGPLDGRREAIEADRTTVQVFIREESPLTPRYTITQHCYTLDADNMMLYGGVTSIQQPE